MKKRLLDIFFVFYLIFGWLFLFCCTITTNYFSNVYKLELKNNDSFSDLTYAKANEYDFQSSLMLRQDYFMQGLDPSNYAFSFGIDLGKWKGESVDKNDSNYWFNDLKINYRSYEITWNSQDASKSWQGKLILDSDNTGRFLKISVYKNDIKYDFLFNIDIIPYLFFPIVANQSYRHFDLNYLIFNSNYKNLINNDIIKSFNSQYFINDIKQDTFSLQSFFQLLDYFYSNVLRVIFDISNFKEFIYFNSSGSNTGFVFFVKNGFLLYPKSMLFNILRFPDSLETYLNPRINLYNAYNINVNQNYYSFFSNWQYQTDILPSNNDLYTQSIKFLDMTDNSKYQGFNLITFNTTNIASSSISINGFNFSLYNSNDWNNEINGGDIWNIPYKNCSWYNVACHVENAGIWLVNNLPGMKDVYNFVSGIVHVFGNVTDLFNNIGNLFAFDITFKIMLSSILVLAMVNGLLRYF
ncbi:spiroplasma phage ORF1-like family protein [Spiroplasma endosymbiont of Stenodema calcarata]|uniref:spiroplasma phage ORF1-like family protein n=1 Tax=Spiroplasma endosymbiont of Stenodema calcarata TaxID=3139328 RepID=UPI003CCADCD7